MSDSGSSEAEGSAYSSSSEEEQEDLPLAQLGQMVNAGGKHLRPPGISSGEESSDGEENQEEEESEPESEEADDSDGDFEADDSDEEEMDGGADSDSSEDVPLASLKSPKAGKKKAPAVKKKTAAKAKKPTDSAKKKKASSTTTKKTNSSSKSSGGGSGDLLLASAELYLKCDKGKLIQSVLCRWWYVAAWPDPQSLPPCPSGYDALDGFPGVYVCTKGSEVGKIVDYRDKETCPSFTNYAKKSSEDLVEMLCQAINTQREQLIKAEGSGTETERDLDKLQSWAQGLNTAKLDRDADKVLRAAKLTL